jgi:Ion channel
LIFHFCQILFTGHGNLTPQTAEGKLVTMLYAIVGVPLMLMCLSSLGELFANALQVSYAKLCASSRTGGGQQKVKFLGQGGHKEVEYHACNEVI